MERGLRRRRWLEVALTAVAAAVCIASLVWSSWVERLVGISPDGGAGELSTLVALVALAAAVAGAWSCHRTGRALGRGGHARPAGDAVRIADRVDRVDVTDRVSVARR